MLNFVYITDTSGFCSNCAEHSLAFGNKTGQAGEIDNGQDFQILFVFELSFVNL